ncbi:HNH endonuclease [Gordonia phage RedWattleHog]|nr:HNH endonuclease [Gordonia phage RedWattleHog]
MKRQRGQAIKPGTSSNGYQLAILNGKARLIHHLVMEAFVGPRPDGADIRHWPDTSKSNNTLSNLSYGTRRQNIMDAVAAGTWNNRNTGKTHCDRGHEFTPENTYVWTGRTGREERQCRACNRMRRQGQL